MKNSPGTRESSSKGVTDISLQSNCARASSDEKRFTMADCVPVKSVAKRIGRLAGGCHRKQTHVAAHLARAHRRCGAVGRRWRVTHTLVTPCDLQTTAAQLRVALSWFRPLHLQRSTHLTVPASVPAIQARLGTFTSCALQQAAIQDPARVLRMLFTGLPCVNRLRFHPPLFHLFALRSSIWRQRAFYRRVYTRLAQGSCSDEQREDADIGHRPS